MSMIRAIRDRLGDTQTQLAQGMGCSQSNVSLYEKGQTVPPSAAKALIAYATTKGVKVTFEDIYGEASHGSAALVSLAPQKGARA
ncbi:Predicted transcriptional regulators [Variovorax sp. HW608]|uniref:helix-turn-helix domain-containing protein n=1 Tax=Variovorax sp. HW608 TaxID=1034889 RepID=UPI00081F8867|nr:helix-turn-helix transcriptional regulator [Variovorax sp. HW608]SCK09077.1 Predicted transcriptional regulators [Variovorax sp. HW608]